MDLGEGAAVISVISLRVSNLTNSSLLLLSFRGCTGAISIDEIDIDEYSLELIGTVSKLAPD